MGFGIYQHKKLNINKHMLFRKVKNIDIYYNDATQKFSATLNGRKIYSISPLSIIKQIETDTALKINAKEFKPISVCYIETDFNYDTTGASTKKIKCGKLVGKRVERGASRGSDYRTIYTFQEPNGKKYELSRGTIYNVELYAVRKKIGELVATYNRAELERARQEKITEKAEANLERYELNDE